MAVFKVTSSHPISFIVLYHVSLSAHAVVELYSSLSVQCDHNLAMQVLTHEWHKVNEEDKRSVLSLPSSLALYPPPSYIT